MQKFVLLQGQYNIVFCPNKRSLHLFPTYLLVPQARFVLGDVSTIKSIDSCIVNRYNDCIKQIDIFLIIRSGIYLSMSSSNVLHPVCIWTFFQATLVSIDGLRLCIRSTPMKMLKSILSIMICKSTFHHTQYHCTIS